MQNYLIGLFALNKYFIGRINLKMNLCMNKLNELFCTN